MNRIKQICFRILFSFLELLPLKYQIKIKIILNVLVHDWRMLPYSNYSNPKLFFELLHTSENEIEDALDGLDKNSIALVKGYIKGQCLYYVPDPSRCFYSMKGLFTKEEEKKGYRMLKELKRCRKKYRLEENGDLSSLIYHHGLKSLPDSVLCSLQGKTFIDAGAYIGDSVIDMMSYQPSRIIAFEPSAANCEKFVRTMKANNIPEERIELVKSGLGCRDSLMHFSDTGTDDIQLQKNIGADTVMIRSLDSFLDGRGDTIGFLKADVEGMAVELLRGALLTIKRDLPVLSLAIYHSKTELLGAYQFLKQNHLNYHYQIQKLCLPWENAELILLCTPFRKDHDKKTF